MRLLLNYARPELPRATAARQGVGGARPEAGHFVEQAAAGDHGELAM
jgi:hypothetical protein